MAEAASRLKEQAAAITYLTGAENELKDKAVELAQAAIAANPDEGDVSVSLYGSATTTAKGTVQTLSLSIRASI
jgi:hypothetical protein